MAYPISLREVKQHLRIDADVFDEDNYIENFIIPAAVDICSIYVDPSALFTDSSCPYSVKQGMLVAAGDLYEKRNSDELQAVKKTDILGRLLNPHKKIYW